MATELWDQVDWEYRPKRPGVNAFARLFRVKMAKRKTLGDIGPALWQSKHWIGFDPKTTVYGALYELVSHLTEAYGLEIVMRDGGLHSIDGEWTWTLSEDPTQDARIMSSLRHAAPSLEPRPYVRNGETDIYGWAVFTSTDWAEMEAADVYATHALFPKKDKVPKAPKRPKKASRRERDPEHAELLAWVSANNEALEAQLVAALEKLETSVPGSNDERDANTQIYRVGRRTRR